MILTQARGVRTSDPGGYAWAGLRRFQNVDLVVQDILRLHNLDAKWKEDVKKQATQLRYCLVQAREYFAASSAVSLATKPNLLYYGTMSLALAEVLLKQDGLSSLDKARGEHKHHGLSISVSDGQNASDLSEAARKLRAIPLEIKGRRKGTFELWHRSSRELPVGGILRTLAADGGSTSTFQVLLGVHDTALPSIPSDGITLLECLRSLPYLSEHCSLHNVSPLTLRAKLEMSARPEPNQEHKLTIALHPSPLNAEFLENFRVEAGWVERIAVREVHAGYLIEMTMYDRLNGPARFSTPHGSMFNTEEVRFWTDQRCLNEFGYFYAALFIAGNYVRYYPDHWLRDVEASTPLAWQSRNSVRSPSGEFLG